MSRTPFRSFQHAWAMCVDGGDVSQHCTLGTLNPRTVCVRPVLLLLFRFKYSRVCLNPLDRKQKKRRLSEASSVICGSRGSKQCQYNVGASDGARSQISRLGRSEQDGGHLSLPLPSLAKKRHRYVQYSSEATAFERWGPSWAKLM